MKHINPGLEAEELLDKFSMPIDGHKNIYYKQCALTAIDIILDFIKFNVTPYTYDKESMKYVVLNKQHYIKVKKEIEEINN